MSRVVYEYRGEYAPDTEPKDRAGYFRALFTDAEVPREGARVQWHLSGQPEGTEFYADQVIWCPDGNEPGLSFVHVILEK
jgi:hypothetical protein